MYRCLDLFAGCGGMSLGFTYAGFKLKGGIEKDSTAIQTHAKNFFGSETKSLYKRHSTPYDITKLPPEKFMEEILGERNPSGLIDVIIGGPPCQAFARVGRAKLREIMEHPDAFLTDDRASMYLYYLKYVEFFRPLAIVMENVPDIMNFGGKNIAEEIAISLENIGYESRYTILNSAYYGVPQMRQRFFLIAIRKDLNVVPIFPDCTHYIKLPQGYQNSHMVALGGMTQSTLFNHNDSQHHYIPSPQPTSSLPKAITAKEALQDLPSIDIKAIIKGRRKFDKLAKYSNEHEPSDYAKLMRQWSGFESSEGVFDHVTRYLPRDYEIFRRMQPGDQYPQAYKIAEQIFYEALHKHELYTKKELRTDSSQYNELRAKFVPPYDPNKFPNSPYDFEITELDGSKKLIDVKSTKGNFNNRIHISYNELLQMREHISYEIYRVFDVKNSNAKLKITEATSEFANTILKILEQLPQKVRSEGISLPPQELIFKNTNSIELKLSDSF